MPQRIRAPDKDTKDNYLTLKRGLCVTKEPDLIRFVGNDRNCYIYYVHCAHAWLQHTKSVVQISSAPNAWFASYQNNTFWFHGHPVTARACTGKWPRIRRLNWPIPVEDLEYKIAIT